MTYASGDGKRFATAAECLAWENGGMAAAERAKETARREKRINHFKNATEDLVVDLLFYDRKEDGELSLKAVEEMLASGEVTKAMIIGWFSAEIDKVSTP